MVSHCALLFVRVDVQASATKCSSILSSPTTTTPTSTRVSRLWSTHRAPCCSRVQPSTTKTVCKRPASASTIPTRSAPAVAEARSASSR
ncbi:UNVERIFIED_CONTAM: hypothetical protein GTU68_000759 [Idotea baltica]|nr:hypothetical protein [Idotea baltica]